MRWICPAVVALSLAAAAHGQVVNPWLTTDSSIDTSSVERVVAQIIKPGMSDEQKAIACWRFHMAHFYHFYPPREPDTAGDVRDFQKAINSYGFGPCFVAAPVLTDVWEAAGFKTRSWTVTGHSIPEVFYGDAWHMIDGDARAFHRKKDGSIAGVQELATDMVLWLKPPGKSDPYYPFGSPTEQVSPLDPWGPPSRMMDLYASTRDNYMYNVRAVNAHPMYLDLRPGETFTLDRGNVGKYFIDASWKTDDQWPCGRIPNSKKEYSVHGPWSVDGTLGYSNGTLVWQPDFKTIPAEQLLWTGSENVKLADGKLAAADANKPAVAVFHEFCPFVLVDVKAALTVSGKIDDAKVEMSFDGGFAWQPVEVPWLVDDLGTNEGLADLSANLRGRYDYLLRVTLANGAALTTLKLTNTFQHATLAMPRLLPGANQVTVRRGPDAGAVYLVRPGGTAAKPRYVVESEGMKLPSSLALADDSKPGYVVFKLTAPDKLVALTIGGEASFDAYGSPRGMKAEWSIDGKNWTQAYYYDKPTNRGNSTIERDVRVELPDCASDTAWYRFSMEKGSKYSGFTSIRLYAHYRLPQPAGAKLNVKLAWEEQTGEKWVAKSLDKTITEFPTTFPVDCAGTAVRVTQIVMTPAG